MISRTRNGRALSPELRSKYRALSPELRSKYRAWYYGWRVVQRGSSRSGNWGHKGVKGRRGGSAPGGGHRVIGIGPEAEDWMVDTALLEYRKERAERAARKKKGEGPELRRKLAKQAEQQEARIKAYGDAAEAAWETMKGHETAMNSAARNIKYIREQGLSEGALEAQREVYFAEKAEVEKYLGMYREWREKEYELGREKNAAQMELLAVPKDQQANVKLTTKIRKGRAEAQEGLDAFNKLCGTGTVNGQKVEVKRTNRSRSFYRDKLTRTYAGFGAGGKDMTVTVGGEVHLSSWSSARTMIHEMGHWLENRDPKIAKRVQSFLARRTRGETAQKLSVLTGDSAYKAYEVAKPDKFMDAYVGKVYGTGSEVISMGLQYMFSGAAKFAKQDPDFFDFMISVLRGQ